jgi:hypothetical protein
MPMGGRWSRTARPGQDGGHDLRAPAEGAGAALGLEALPGLDAFHHGAGPLAHLLQEVLGQGALAAVAADAAEEVAAEGGDHVVADDGVDPGGDEAAQDLVVGLDEAGAARRAPHGAADADGEHRAAGGGAVGVGELGGEGGDEPRLPAGAGRPEGAAGGALEVGDDDVAAGGERGLHAAPGGLRGGDGGGPHGEAAARLADAELGAEDELLFVRPGQDHADRLPALPAEGLADGGQGRRGEAGLLHVVEADHGELLRDPDAAARERLDHADGDGVVGAGDGLEIRRGPGALVEEAGHRPPAGLGGEVARDHELGVVGHRGAGEDVAVGGEAPLGLGVRRGAADEGDPAHAVVDHEVAEHGAGAGGVVHRDGGGPGDVDPDEAHGQRPEAIADAEQGLAADLVAERAREDHEAVHGAGADERVQAAPGAGVGVEGAALEAEDPGAPIPGGLPRALQDGPLVAVAQRLDEEAHGERAVDGWGGAHRRTVHPTRRV